MIAKEEKMGNSKKGRKREIRGGVGRRAGQIDLYLGVTTTRSYEEEKGKRERDRERERKCNKGKCGREQKRRRGEIEGYEEKQCEVEKHTQRRERKKERKKGDSDTSE